MLKCIKKRGMNLSLFTVIFLVLNLIFFSMMFYYVSKSSNGALVYEQIYSKEISMVLDSLSPGDEVIIDFSEPYSVAKEHKTIQKLITIDSKNKQLIVSLSSRGGYATKYFSNYKFVLEELFNEKSQKIKITVEDNDKII
jgi:hypothetical protein